MVRIVGWITAVAGGEWLLLALGGGSLAGPPLDRPQVWSAWVAARDTDVVVVALLRLGALWVGAYLLAVLVAGALVRGARAHALVGMLDLVTPAAVRRLLDQATGVAAVGAFVVASVASSASPAAADGHERPPGPPVTLRGLSAPRPDPLPTTTTTIEAPPAAPPTTEAAALPPAETPPADAMPPPPTEPVPHASGGQPYVPSPPAPGGGEPYVPAPPAAGGGQPSVSVPAAPAADDTWTVRRGDNFWSIAEALLADAWARPPTAREVDPYWRALIEANRGRLADADNPDLLFPGQVLAVPPPPASAA